MSSTSSTTAETDAGDQVPEEIKARAGSRGRSRGVAALVLLLSLVTMVVYAFTGSGNSTDGRRQVASVLVPGSGFPPSIGSDRRQGSDPTIPELELPPSDKRPAQRNAVPSPLAGAPDEELNKLVVGQWRRQFHGQRTLTVAPDGTASMVIEPNQIWSLAFGSRLETRIKWKIEAGRIIYRTTSGTPVDKYELAAKTWGTAWNEAIEKLDATSLVLLDDNGERYEYTRVGSKSK